MARYRRNGTPIGKYKVYALVLKSGEQTQVFEIVPQGIETYEELDMLVELEKMAGRFGHGYDRLAITRPGVYLEEANLDLVNIQGCNLSGANLCLCDMEYADLDNCNFSGADLEGAELFGSSMNNVNLSGANLRDAQLAQVDMAYGTVPHGWRRDVATGKLFNPSWRPTE